MLAYASFVANYPAVSFRRIVGLASALLLACGGEDGASETAGVTGDVSFSCEEGESDALYEQRIVSKWHG